MEVSQVSFATDSTTDSWNNDIPVVTSCLEVRTMTA